MLKINYIEAMYNIYSSQELPTVGTQNIFVPVSNQIMSAAPPSSTLASKADAAAIGSEEEEEVEERFLWRPRNLKLPF